MKMDQEAAIRVFKLIETIYAAVSELESLAMQCAIDSLRESTDAQSNEPVPSVTLKLRTPKE